MYLFFIYIPCIQVPQEEVAALASLQPVPVTSFGPDTHLNDLRLSLPRNVSTKDTPLVSGSLHEMAFLSRSSGT